MKNAHANHMSSLHLEWLHITNRMPIPLAISMKSSLCDGIFYYRYLRIRWMTFIQYINSLRDLASSHRFNSLNSVVWSIVAKES